MDLADLIVAAGTPEPTVEIDPLVDPDGALTAHRQAWPLNAVAAAGTLPEPPEAGSDRVRMRRCAKELAEAGLTLNGSFADSMPKANLQVDGYFRGDGNLSGPQSLTVSVVDSGPLGDESLLRAAQEALQRWGFAVVVGVDGCLHGIEPGDADAALWAEVGGAPGYLGSGVTPPSPQELMRYRLALGSIGARRDSAGEWAASSFDLAAAQEWCAHDVGSPREAEQWMHHGLVPREAQEWLAAGLVYYRARPWLDAGYRVADAAPWTALGCDHTAAQQWIDRGISVADATPWIKLGYDGWRMRLEMEHVDVLMAHGVDGDDVRAMSAAGCGAEQLTTLAKWIARYKITVDEALAWAKLGVEFCGPQKRGRWHKAGYTAEQVAAWQKALGRRAITLDEVRAKEAAGFDPEVSATWSALCELFDDAVLVAGWTDAGLTPDDARPWVTLHPRFCRQSRVAGWTDAGLAPDDARAWVDAHPDFCDYALVQRFVAAYAPLADNPALAAELHRVTAPEALAATLDLLDRR